MFCLDKKTRISVWLIGSVFIAFLLSLFSGKNIGSFLDWINIVPQVVTIELILYYVFKIYIWKWNRLYPKVIPFPNLSGTWCGHLISSYIDPETNEELEPIPCMINVVRNFNEISFKLITHESTSYSHSEKLVFDKEKNKKEITFSYANEPKTLLDDRSNNHKGTTILALINDNKLEGLYYTDRETKGELYLKFKTTELLDELPKDTKE